jgi:fructose-1,6-bisphosphatase I
MDAVEAVFEALAETVPDIREGFVGRREYQGGENPSGEEQLAADVHADRLLEERLLAVDGVGTYASEEREEVIGDGSGLAVAVDPLDGSSNLTSNNTMGTIVGIYDAPLPARGCDLVGAAYTLYGPITTMMSAADDEATEYVIEGGERRVVTDAVALPAEPTVYGFGGRVPDWTDEFTDYARDIEADTNLKLRYSGAMIGDVNQVLTYGGVFAYPELESAPSGKLRLQFEGNPIAYIVESAGGRSSNGERSLLDIDPEDLHGRAPVHVGNAALIDRLEATLDG